MPIFARYSYLAIMWQRYEELTPPVQMKLPVRQVGVLVHVVDPLGVKHARPALYAMHLIPF